MPKKKTKSSTNGERNWSELPEDILHLFSKKLYDISDFISFRAVCKSWRLSAPVTDPPQQLPWILELPHKENRENVIIRLYCLSSGKVHTISCPGSCLAHLDGSGCCYLPASHFGNSERYLLNPLTNDQIHVSFVSVLGGWCLDYIGPDSIKGGDIVVISDVDYFYMGWNTPSPRIAFWRPKADDWIYVEGISPYPSGNAFYMGQYFNNDFVTGITNVIDITTKKMAYQVAPPEDQKPLLKGRTIIVESGGKILRLFQHYVAEQWLFDIHCLYFGDGEGKPCWVKITDIGDQMLFVQNYSGLSFCASNFARFKGNCIYFLEAMQYLCRYDTGDCTTEVLPCPFDLVGAWFLPSLIKLSSKFN